MALFTSKMKHAATKMKPFVPAGREIALAMGSLYCAEKAMPYTLIAVDKTMALLESLDKYKKEIYLNEESEEIARYKYAKYVNDLQIKIDTSLTMAKLSLQITIYAGISKLMGKLLPTTRSAVATSSTYMWRRPLPLFPHTIVAGSLAFIVAPVFSIFNCSFISPPIIKLYHETVSKKQDVLMKHESASTLMNHESASTSGKMLPPTTAITSNTGTTASECMECSQTSIGTKVGASIEAIAPGTMTFCTPLLEEIFFRGMLFGRLVPSIGSIPAALSSSVIFGATHKVRYNTNK